MKRRRVMINYSSPGGELNQQRKMGIRPFGQSLEHQRHDCLRGFREVPFVSDVEHRPNVVWLFTQDTLTDDENSTHYGNDEVDLNMVSGAQECIDDRNFTQLRGWLVPFIAGAFEYREHFLRRKLTHVGCQGISRLPEASTSRTTPQSRA